MLKPGDVGHWGGEGKPVQNMNTRLSLFRRTMYIFMAGSATIKCGFTKSILSSTHLWANYCYAVVTACQQLGSLQHCYI